MMRRITSALVLATSMTLAGSAAAEDTFTFEPAGALAPTSGTGREDDRVYVPAMRFPIESGPAYANSQVWGHGGNSGPKGSGQCDAENYSYPWRDNYCESRSWAMPLCPSGTGHQGQDIRAATCEKDVHWVVAASDGTVTNIGSYSVYVTASDGTRFDYLHMSEVTVKEGDDVKRGQRLGKVSNQFGGTPTTVHLHFNIRQNVAGVGFVFVPPYASLVDSYKELLNPTPPPPDPPPTAAPAAPPPPKEPTSQELPAEPEPEPQMVDSGCASAPASTSTGALALVLGVTVAGAIRRRAGRRAAR